MANEFVLPGGRLVQGHPMDGKIKVDDTTKQPRMSADGVTPKMDFFYAIAIEKKGEQNWNQTEWGSQIYAAGVEGWQNGAYNNQFFAWKIVDGDSQEVDQGGRAPCAKEGFPGHWIVKINSGFPTPCWHAGKLQPHEVIQNKNEIKCGDYVRAKISVIGNGPDNKSPGVYINPKMFELSRPGVQILSASIPDAAEAFGGSQAQFSNNAQFDNSVQQNNQNGQQQQHQQQQQQQQNGGYQQQNNQNGQQNNGGQQQQNNQNGQQNNNPQGHQQADQSFLNNGQG